MSCWIKAELTTATEVKYEAFEGSYCLAKRQLIVPTPDQWITFRQAIDKLAPGTGRIKLLIQGF